MGRPVGRPSGQGRSSGRWRLVSLAFLLLFCALLAGAVCSQPAEFSAIRHKNILLLHSYSSDYTWTRNLNDGAMAVLENLDWSNNVRVEYMDTKNNSGEDYYRILTELLKNKYGSIRFDGIIATDNNAMNFLGESGSQLFPGVTIVATGINGVGLIPIPAGITTVVAEVADHKATISQALALRPGAKRAYLVADTTTTGQAILAEVERVLPAIETEVEFTVVDQLSIDELVAFASTRDPEDFIYLLPYFRDGRGQVFDQGHVATAMALVATVPIFVSWDFQLMTGTLGGRVVSGRRLGEIAAELLLRGLGGEKLEMIETLDEDITISMYDFTVAQRFGLAAELFPADTWYLNRPVSFLDRHRAVLIPGGVLVAGLLVLLVLILVNLKKQRVINRHSRRIIELDQEVIETQRELVSTLGEVIETRSRETGNHVRRVAKISRLLAEEVGLSEEEADVIEAASPLHDVGKIGIPDAILHSPDKLTEEEFLAMQRHTTIGKDILKYSDRKLLAAGCCIAHQHHERWDGSGYPEGLKGEEIHIFARITTLADVFDALSTERAYKPAWPEERVLAFIAKEKGGIFDPFLVEIFFARLDQIRAIRKRFAEDEV